MHLMCAYVPYVHLTRTLRTVYEWLRVPTTANHTLMLALRVPTCTLCVTMRTLCAPYVHLTHTLHVPTCALCTPMRTLCAPYVHLHAPYVHLCAPYVCLTCTLRMPTCALCVPCMCLTCTLHMPTCALHMPYVHLTCALQVYDLLRVPTTANQITDI